MNQFLKSALVRDIRDSNGLSLEDWFVDRKEAHRFKIEEIPFSALKQWGFDADSGNLVHDTGKFFSIEGVSVKTNWGNKREWSQPIINQPEIGFLGFITKEIDGVLYFLVQAKMEPGNINMIQLAPTLQATKSNFTLVHKGKAPPYLDHFTDHAESKVLVDVLQSEQGARFLRKRNRNIIIQIFDEMEVRDDYCWMSLGQLLEAMQYNNLVNMDARTVLSCIDFGKGVDELNESTPLITEGLISSFSKRQSALHSNETIISWFTERKFSYELEVERIPLNQVRHWERTEYELRHESGKYFSVIACNIEADSREVFSWTQPLIKPHQRGLIAFVAKNFNGTLHFLVQAKVEPGNFDVVEMAPTVQCLTGSYEEAPSSQRPPFTDHVLNATPERVLFDTLQSEEGGRFYREENRNIIILADEDFPDEIPENYIWMTAGQLKEFIKYNNFVNVQARCLLSSLSFT